MTKGFLSLMTETARDNIAIPILILLDLSALGLSILAALLIRSYLIMPLFPGSFQPELLAGTFYNIWWFPLVLLFCLAYENLYSKRLPFWIEMEYIFKAVTLAIVITVFILYLSKTADDISRALIVSTWLILGLMLPLMRWYGKLFLVRANLWKRPVLVIGTGESAQLIMKALSREKTMGYEVAGLLTEGGNEEFYNQFAKDATYSILGTVEKAEYFIDLSGVKDVIIAVSTLSPPDLVNLANRLQQVACNVLLVPDLLGLSLSGIEVQYFFEEQTLLLHIKNRLKSSFNKSVKRTFDLLLGLSLLILSLPLMILISAAIKIDSWGPVLYIGERIGQGGKIFRCLKFRTMYIEADQILKSYLENNQDAQKEWNQYKKLITSDPRVTRAGAILRRFSLDELPQVLNIIPGQMSLVGPRPYLSREKAQMGDWYNDIIVAKPGLTGLWQVSGRNLISFEGRLKLDVWYMKNWSPWLDIMLILKTLRVVLKTDGAY